VTAIVINRPDANITDASAVPNGRVRVEAVDIVRGLAMIVMALDHTRDFLGSGSVNPTDVAHTTAALFLTRWITHFCAPIFFLLTGTSAHLARRGRSARQLSQYLFTRGLWLMLLDVTVFRWLGLQFNFSSHVIILNVLWALGWAMVVLSLLVHLPRPAIAAFGILLIAGHNLLDSVSSSQPLWTLLHVQNFILSTPAHSILVVFPLIPWVGVTALGYALGTIYSWTRERRRALLLSCGIGMTVAFVVLRAVDAYGDPAPWSAQHSAVQTAISFLDTTKYPPSLLFLLMTLGPALILLAAFDGGVPRLLRPVSVYGKVPLFYFLVHVPLIHLLAAGACYVRFGQAYGMFETPSVNQFPVAFPPGWGFSLPVVYLAWIVVVVSLYPLCSWYAAVKMRRASPWLSYI
jgi:uncharacterized membrane protein